MLHTETRQVCGARKRNAKENFLGALGFIERELTLGERFALAFTVKSIHGLPDFLQRYSNACDMLDMLEGKDCWRGGLILGEALEHFQSISGFREGALDEIEKDFMTDACEKFIAEATAAGVAYVASMEKKVDDLDNDNASTMGIPLSAFIQ